MRSSKIRILCISFLCAALLGAGTVSAALPNTPEPTGNQAPIAENLSLTTYKNVAVTGHLQAMDAEGDVLTFQVTSTPARGSVALAEDGTSRFVYTPYNNKTGKDAFTFVAVDRMGNISNPAKVTVRIEKAKTAVTYSDMENQPAHKAAIHLAEQDIFVGAHVGGQYFFAPDATVSRSQFLAMAMMVADLDPLEQISVTGFADDTVIPTWAKGYVSSALRAGVIHGARDEEGRIVFLPDAPVTRAQATVILNDLLDVTDVAVQSWSSSGVDVRNSDHWAMQAAVNLTTAGVLDSATSSADFDSALTRAEVAELLDNSLELLSQRKEHRFGW